MEKIEDDNFIKWVQRLANKGLNPSAAFNYLEQARIEALRRLLIKENVIKEMELKAMEVMVMEEFVKKIEKMPPLPNQ